MCVVGSIDDGVDGGGAIGADVYSALSRLLDTLKRVPEARLDAIVHDALVVHRYRGASSLSLGALARGVESSQAARADSCLAPLDAPQFCTERRRNVSGWYDVYRKQIPWRLDTQAVPHNASEWARDSTWYCDKLPAALHAPVPLRRYTRRDVAIAVVSGANLLQSRGAAARDTWMMAFPRAQLYATRRNAVMPVAGVLSMREEARRAFPLEFADDPRRSNQWVHLYAIKHMYERHRAAPWFVVLGCDNYVDEHAFMALLQPFDATRALWLAHERWGPVPLPRHFPVDEWPRYSASESALVANRSVQYTTGSTSWLMSNAVARDYADNVDRFVATIRRTDTSEYAHTLFDRFSSVDSCGCQSFWSGMLLTLLGHRLHHIPQWTPHMHWGAVDGGAHSQQRWRSWHNAESKEAAEQVTAVARALRLDADGRDALRRLSNASFALFHNVHPYRMYALHQRSVHEHVERLHATRSVRRVLAFARRTIDRLFEALRRRQAEALWLAALANMDVRPFDIRVPLRQWADNDASMGDYETMWRGARDYGERLSGAKPGGAAIDADDVVPNYDYE